MKQFRKNRSVPAFFDQRQTKAGFLHLFGSHSLLVILLASLSIITLDWFGDGIWNLVSLVGKMLLSSTSIDRQVMTIFGRLIWFPCMLVGWWFLIRKSFDSVANLIVNEQSGAPGCKVLIIFLSPPGKDVQLIQKLLEPSGSGISGKIENRRFRENFGSSWRMPLEAINFHLQQKTLERVMMVPSATVRTATGEREGTFKYFQDFKHLVEKLAPAVSVHRAGEADREKWMEGVDYESARALRNCLSDIFQFLLDTEHYQEEDILIDIASGQKLVSSIGTLLSLQKGRQIQYVSTTDYSVKSYNIDYEEK